ncbi:putative receptor protein kinase [Spatholobus suberectus]|nr:putative receptor protein kinase [Spatholobus suberectus]
MCETFEGVADTRFRNFTCGDENALFSDGVQDELSKIFPWLKRCGRHVQVPVDTPYDSNSGRDFLKKAFTRGFLINYTVLDHESERLLLAKLRTVGKLTILREEYEGLFKDFPQLQSCKRRFHMPTDTPNDDYVGGGFDALTKGLNKGFECLHQNVCIFVRLIEVELGNKRFSGGGFRNDIGKGVGDSEGMALRNIWFDFEHDQVRIENFPHSFFLSHLCASVGAMWCSGGVGVCVPTIVDKRGRDVNGE